MMSASTGGIIASGYPGMTAEVRASEEENALTLSVYALGSVTWNRAQFVKIDSFRR